MSKHNKVPAAAMENGDVVTPWTVESTSKTGIDYDKLIVRFGSSAIPPDMCQKFEELSRGKKAHHLLSRGIFFSHREFDQVLESYAKGIPFYLYTGRGPSSEAMHTGHLIPFIFTKWLQDIFDIPLLIQLTDDEKYLWKNLTIQEARRLAHENAKDIIALGYDVNKTLIFNDLDFVSRCPPLYYTIIALHRRITFQQVKSVLPVQPPPAPVSPGPGDTTPLEDLAAAAYDSESIARIAYPAVKCAAALPCAVLRPLRGAEKAIRSLIVCPHGGTSWTLFAHILRGCVARSETVAPPAVLGFQPFPGLQSTTSVMDPNEVNSAIFLRDSAKVVKDKVNKYAFSGGGVSKEEHEKNGGNCEVDVAFNMLRYLLHSDERLHQIETDYRSGKLLTGFLKKELIDLLNELFQEINQRRAALTEEDLKKFLPLPENGCPLNFEMDHILRKCEVTPEAPSLVPMEVVMSALALDEESPPLHPMIRRGLCDVQIDLEDILAAVNRGEKDSFYIFYSHCPTSESLHLGELVPLLFVKWLQEHLGGVHVVIHITDDEHYFLQSATVESDTWQQSTRLGAENKRDIAALGFDASRTLIFTTSEVMTPFYANICRVQRRVTFNQVKGIFGFTESDWIGKIGFPAVQASPCFSSGFPEIFENDAVKSALAAALAAAVPETDNTDGTTKTDGKKACKKTKKTKSGTTSGVSTGSSDVFCLIPCAIDQDPYFRMTRDVAPRLGWKKPTLVHSTFFPALQGGQSKMSASDVNSAIFLTDSRHAITEKIMNHAYCNPNDYHEDVPYQYLKHFSENEEKLRELVDMYAQGNVDVSAVKKELIKVLWTLLEDVQLRRERIDDAVLHSFLARRALNYKPTGF